MLLLTELENLLFLAGGEPEEVSEGSSKLGTVRMVEGTAPLVDFGESA